MDEPDQEGNRELSDICWESDEDELPPAPVEVKESPEYFIGRGMLLWAYDKAKRFYEAVGRYF
ncbi:MAG: hypothetical protein KJ574_03055 [Nanoarchaeota archaeon]|nr:hypothetical protein [Nanoarchaeota archaeon]